VTRDWHYRRDDETACRITTRFTETR